MTVSNVHYVAGSHPALVWSGGVVVLAAGVDVAVAAATWERLRALPTPTTVGAVLTELGEASGARLLDLPPFAIAVVCGPDEAHLAVRGSFEIVATADDASATTISGQDVATWAERRVTVTALHLGRVDETPAGEQMPIESGVVGVAAVSVELSDAPAVADVQSDPAVVEHGEDADFEPRIAKTEGQRAPNREPSPDAAAQHQPVPRPDADADPDRARGTEPSPGESSEPLGDGFDDIWADYTVAGSVEGAAVRPDAPSLVEPVAGSQPGPPSEVTWLEDKDDEEVADSGEQAGSAGPIDPDESHASDDPVPPMAQKDKPSTQAPMSDYISAVPGMPAGPAPSREMPAPPPDSPVGVAPSPDRAVGEAGSSAALGDHDGHTIAALPGNGGSGLGPLAGPAGREVLAVLCTAGHGNPPQRAHCRVCGGGLNAAPTRIAQPSLGRVHVSSGEHAELDGPVIIGRAPRASRFQGTSIPRLMTLQHPHISASHVALRIEGWSVLAVDLNSTNGTFLRRNGEPPFRLLEQPQLLVAGDVIDLGHGVHLRFEELP